MLNFAEAPALKGTLFCHLFSWPLTPADLGFEIGFTFELFIYCRAQDLIYHIVFATFISVFFLFLAVHISESEVKSLVQNFEGQNFFSLRIFF